MANSIRDYMRIVENLDESRWWGSAKTSAPAAATNQQAARSQPSQPATVVGRATSTAAYKAPRIIPEYSEAITNMEDEAGQLRLAPPNSRQARDHVEMITRIANHLIKMAPQSGMDRFVPTLQAIIASPNTSLAAIKKLSQDTSESGNSYQNN